MRLFHGFNDLPKFTRPVVTVGSYDGVHLGHRALLDRVVAEAHAIGGESIVLTFDPHPRIALGRAEGLRLLTTLDEKVALLAGIGIDNVVVIPFDRDFAAMSGVEFVRRYLRGVLGAETIVVGYNHRFGHDRADGHAIEGEGLHVVAVDECSLAGEKISSTEIRRLIAQGAYSEAERLLGHPLKINDKDHAY